MTKFSGKNVVVNKEVSAEAINKKFKSAARGKMKGVLEYSEVPLVSSDIVGSPSSSVFDSLLTEASGRMIKVVSWYDNEAGYSARLADMCRKVAALGPVRKPRAKKK